MKHADLRLLACACGLWCGVIGGYTIGLGATIASLAVVAALVASWYLIARHSRPAAARYWIPVIVAIIASLALGSALAVIHDQLRSPAIREAARDERIVTLTGRLASYPSISAAVYRELDVHSIDASATRGSVRLVGDADLAEADLGDILSVRVRLEATEPGDEHLAWARVRSWEVIEPASGIEGYIAAKRSRLYERLDSAPPAVRGLVPGLAIGDDSQLPDQSAEAMTGVNLTHLTAVSGAHVSMICGIVLAIVGRRRRTLAVLACASTLLVLLIATGWQASVMRAGVMGGVILLALLLQRPRSALPALGVAIILLIAASPPIATSYGFALSVIATAAILLLTGWATSLLEPAIGRIGANALAVPIVAHLACAPVLAGLSDTSSIWSALANTAAAPVVPAGTVTALVALADIPLLSSICLLVARWCVTWIDVVGRTMASWPGSDMDARIVVASYLLVLLLCLLIGRGLVRRRWIIVTALGAVASYALLPRPWDLLVCDVGQGTAVLLKHDGITYLVDTGTEDSPLNRCLRTYRARVDVLVLTHLHDDHMGHAPRLSQTIPTWVGPGMTDQARALGISVTGELRAGDRFGPWQVLWPPAPRPCSTTNCENDQSLVMLSTTSPSVLTTGDIEAPAQSALAGTRADIVIVPHHGSPNADNAFIDGLGASHAIVPVGENTYGHPAPAILERYGRSARVETTLDGDVSVVMGY